MAYTVDKVDVWAGTIEDRPGGLAEKLEPLANAKINLDFIIARRQPEQPGTGVVFVAPIAGAAESRVAKAAGLSKAQDMFSLRLEGPDKAGLGAKVARALADAGVNLRGYSGAALGRKATFYFSFDDQADAKKAGQVLKKEFGG
jgi:hypothetical protein